MPRDRFSSVTGKSVERIEGVGILGALTVSGFLLWQDPYLDVPEASTYELSACYNVSVDCRSGDMIARIKTSKLFSGKIYAKGSPNSCVQDVQSSLEFELRMAYDDLECNVKHQGLGRYLNDVVIQHHDTIVTSSDLGLAVTCQYDLTNKSVSNEVRVH